MLACSSNTAPLRAYICLKLQSGSIAPVALEHSFPYSFHTHIKCEPYLSLQAFKYPAAMRITVIKGYCKTDEAAC
jgi:hypothetical protein